MTTGQVGLAALGARVHLFVRPEARAAFEALFRDVLGCEVKELDFGLDYPILFVGFGDGSGFSVEFTEMAPAELARGSLTDATAWLRAALYDAAARRRASIASW